jgi:hypothetical protein
MKWIWWTLGISGGIFLIGYANKRRIVKKLEDVKLSENFSLAEFVRTSTGLDNIPGPEEVANIDYQVQNFLQPLRSYLGMRITVTSGYRSLAVNKKAVENYDAVTTSQHSKGEATDWVVYVSVPRNGESPAQAISRALEKVPKHLSLTTANLEEITKARTDKYYFFKLTNQTLINIILKLRLPYDQIIDEVLYDKEGKIGKWIHSSLKRIGSNRKRILTARNQWISETKQRTKTAYVQVA